jgi:hypothetical protein
MNINSSQWLITFSDLFFILVSFFVIRHELIEIPKLQKVYGTITDGIETLQDTESVFQNHQEQYPEHIQVPIERDWFSHSGEISLRGEIEIKTIAGIYQTTPSRVELLLHKGHTDTPQGIYDRIQEIITFCRKSDIMPASITLVSTHYQRSSTIIGELRLEILP